MKNVYDNFGATWVIWFVCTEIFVLEWKKNENKSKSGYYVLHSEILLHPIPIYILYSL